jgi:rubrerythrin
MPMKKERYAANFQERARAEKDAAGWKCRKCGMPHMGDGTMGSCLTVHHPHRDPENPKAKLIALCARCHLADERQRRIV